MPSVKLFTKIQEPVPCHRPALPNKEIGYLVHVEHDRLYKLKNCIDSRSANSELYKKFSNDFVSNIRNGANQLVVCCGLESEARVETSLGTRKNPGLLMISGITALDQKYRQDHKSFDVEVSFLEYSEGKLYDLLRYTREPLKARYRSQGADFGESSFKILGFQEFLKMMKIALFNNKERDLKADFKGEVLPAKSTLLMTLTTKSYRHNRLITQKSSIVDFGTEESTIAQRSVWEYFQIELNNMTSRKKQHCLLVKPNPLISLIKEYFETGTIFVLNSMSANPASFTSNHAHLQSLQSIIDEIPTRKEEQGSPSRSEVIRSLQQSACSQIWAVVSEIQNGKYQSLREYRHAKQNFIEVLQQTQQQNRKCLKFLRQCLQVKRRLKITEHCLIMDQLKLVGSCVKSDNYKDFYNAKSYVSLERETSIKSEEAKKQISQILQQQQTTEQQFVKLKAAHCIMRQRVDPQLSIAQGLKILISHINELFTHYFYDVSFIEARCIADEILREQSICDQVERVNQQIKKALEGVDQLAKKNSLSFEEHRGGHDHHLSLFLRQMNQRIRQGGENVQKKLRRGMNKGEVDCVIPAPGKFTKLPLQENRNRMTISGNICLADCLLNPDLC